MAENADLKQTCNEDGSPCQCTPFHAEKQAQSIKVDLSDGETKYICTCTKSSKFPFCDGTHLEVNKETGADFKPVAVNKDSHSERISVCACGHSKNRNQKNEDGSYKLPACDGSHRKVVPAKE